ncbi:MAG: recombinase family protein [Defluviitaleaceae bacterium]|nr:recombinase family protein [Defluviitaleaceae bacterium]
MSALKKQKDLIPAVIYARYSSHSQQDQSIDGQLRDCYAFAEREGFFIVGEYIDRALSAKTDDRPDFQRMVTDSAKKQFAAVIVWKLDRFARNRYDSAMYKAKLKKSGVNVVSATENISSDPEGIILEGMLESMAEYYSANLSKHVKRGQREAALKGNHVGGKAPFGYKIEDKKLVKDEKTAPIIQYVFEQYAKGASKRKIIDELNQKGHRNQTGKLFTLKSFQGTLRNTKYIGKYMHKGEEVVGVCPPLIDEKIFFTVQDKLTAKKHAPATAKARQDFLLQGKAYCGLCGTRLVGDAGTSRTGKVHNYYACGRKKKLKTCKKTNEKKGFLEWYVVEQTLEYVLTPERIKYIASRIVQAHDNEFNNQKIKEIENRITRLDIDINKAVNASLEAPDKIKKHYYEKIETLEAQKIDTEQDLARLHIANNIRYTEEQITAWLETFCKGDPLDETFQRRIIDVFINSIYIYDNKLIIYYNIKDGKQISYIEMKQSTKKPNNPEAIQSNSGSDLKCSNRSKRAVLAAFFLIFRSVSQGYPSFLALYQLLYPLAQL